MTTLSLLQRFVILNFACLFCLTLQQPCRGQSPENRTWNSRDRKFSVEAKFHSFSDSSVHLTKVNGEVITVPVARLSLEDHQYIATESGWGRVWRSSKGKVLYVAEFGSLARGDKVRLTSITGRTLSISRTALDKESQSYIAEKLAEASRPGSPTRSKVPQDVVESEKIIRQRIAECVRQSKQLRIDGSAADWQRLPTLTSNVAHRDGSLDITRVGIAPRQHDLVVMIQTRERPSKEPFSFYIRVDFYGRQYGHDFQISVGGSSSQIKVRDEAKKNETIVDTTVRGVNAQIRDVVEVQIPYSVIEPLLPAHMQPLLTGQDARPFLRVETLAFDRKSRAIVDYGPSIASYRYLSGAYPLDEPAPANDRNALPVAVPFQGKWLIGHGAMGYVTHLNIHAYDFYIHDHLGQPAKVIDSSNNDDYYSFGLPIRSPIQGRVVTKENDQLDGKPKEKVVRRSNRVSMSVLGDDELRLYMLHFQKDSVGVEIGQMLSVGDPIALTGNSGMSGFAHLHLELTKGRRPGLADRPKSPDDAFTRPIAFEKAVVSLNPVPDDPWTRYVENWEIRTNLYVEAVR